MLLAIDERGRPLFDQLVERCGEACATALASRLRSAKAETQDGLSA